MPWYVFKCPEHGEFEIKLKPTAFSEVLQVQRCPQCGEISERVYTPQPFSMKGSE
jgi:putative FmdB family regulatory protein